MNETRRIAPGIKAAHSRIAKEYGLVDLTGAVRRPSYPHWVMDRYGWRHMGAVFHNHLGGACRLLIDAGCGNGQFSQYYLESGAATVLGLDFSESMLRTACERASLAGLRDRFMPVMIELEHLDAIRPGIADMIQLYGVTEHLDDPWRVIANLSRLLRPGGVLLISVPRRWSLPFFYYVLFGNSPHYWGQPPNWRRRFQFRDRLRYYRFYNRRQVRRMIESATDGDLIERRGFAHSILDGKLAAIADRLVRRWPATYRWLDRMDAVFRLWPIPGAEYLAIRRSEQSR